MNSFTLQTQLTRNQYLKLSYQLMFSKAWVLFICAFGVLFIVFSAVMRFTGNTSVFDSDYYTYGVTVTFWAILLTIIPTVTVLLTFKSNQMLQELINYEFTEEGVNVKGESFTATYKWEKFYKIKGINGWMLLYQSKRSANIIRINPENGPDVKALKDYLDQSNFKIKVEI